MQQNYQKWKGGDNNVICQVCTKCSIKKPLTEYYQYGKYKPWARCKSCARAYNRTNNGKYPHIQQKFRQNNYQRCLEATRKWRKANLAYDAFRAAMRRATLKQRTPKWANKELIKQIYINCPKGYEVDHIIPLKGIKASGLHIETNLQYLLPKENRQKRNLYGW